MFTFRKLQARCNAFSDVNVLDHSATLFTDQSSHQHLEPAFVVRGMARVCHFKALSPPIQDILYSSMSLRCIRIAIVSGPFALCQIICFGTRQIGIDAVFGAKLFPLLVYYQQLSCAINNRNTACEGRQN